MIGGANRSRLFELRRERGAARRSAELLERKREVLLRELWKNTAARDALRESIAPRYRRAHELLRIAKIEAGVPAIRDAALAQSPPCRIERHITHEMGVALVRLTVTCEPFRAAYSTAGTTESVDVAGASFAELLPDLVSLAEREHAVAQLRAAVRKVTKLLNALQKVVIPRILREIRAIVDGIEEEERDEAVRRRYASPDHTHQ